MKQTIYIVANKHRDWRRVAHSTPLTSGSRYWSGVGLLTEKAIHPNTDLSQVQCRASVGAS
ncbi:hypothetical protein [Scytonema sp. PCC 10023]|uniref:hypothetical protein n=1 Tax=Scytonema sp. PCC 10023 TaxID=1680591 RepID=UPI0039C70DC8